MPPLWHADGVRGRWAVFLVALGASALLAAGFGLTVARLAAATEPAPQLRTVPAGTLQQAGFSVAGAGQPPYCDLGRDGARRRWVSGGVAGCAITRAQAEDALLPGFQQSVREAVLARVSGPDGGAVGRNRLVWMVVVESSLLVLPPSGCAAAVSTGPVCPVPSTNQAVVLIDGTTAEVLTTVPVISLVRSSSAP